VAREEAEGQKLRVYMGAFLRHAWHVSFLEADLKTSIGPGLGSAKYLPTDGNERELRDFV
jgi:hypothetical protein